MALPQLLAAGTGEASVSVTPTQWHELIHMSVDAAGAGSTGPIYFAFNGAAVVASDAAGENKLRLASGARELLAPGVGVISYKTASGSPIFMLKPTKASLYD